MDYWGGNIISIQRETNTQNVRNRIVCYGKTPIKATASAANPYLVVDQTAVIAHELVDLQSLAEAVCAVNLELLNRLQITLTMDLLGDSSIKARSVYHVSNSWVGSEEDVFVYKVSHSWGQSGFVTNVTATA